MHHVHWANISCYNFVVGEKIGELSSVEMLVVVFNDDIPVNIIFNDETVQFCSIIIIRTVIMCNLHVNNPPLWRRGRVTPPNEAD